MCDPPLRGSTQVNDVRLSYLDWGGLGPNCLLLHGITSNARTWWRLAPALVNLGFRTVALDMPGHGDSAETADHRIEAQAELVAGFVRQSRLAPVTVIGHSWGGAIALGLASEHAELVARVVLMDPALTMSADDGHKSLTMFSRGLGAAVEKNSAALRTQNPDWLDQDIHWKAEAMLQCRADAVAGFFTKSGNWNLTPSLAAVVAPLLLLVADPTYTILSVTTRTAAEQVLASTRSHITSVAGTSHNMYRGAGFEPTLDALTRWLQSE